MNNYSFKGNKHCQTRLFTVIKHITKSSDGYHAKVMHSIFLVFVIILNIF